MPKAGWNRRKLVFNQRSVDFLLLMGFLHGDGSIGACRVTFYAGSDLEQRWLRGLVSRVFGFEPKVFVNDRYHIWHVDINRMAFVDFVKEHGFVNGRERRVMPFVFKASKVCRRAFLRGYFEADGTVVLDRRSGRVGIQVGAGSSAAGLARDIGQLLIGLGVSNSVKGYKDGMWHINVTERGGRQAFIKQIGFISQAKLSRLDLWGCNDER